MNFEKKHEITVKVAIGLGYIRKVSFYNKCTDLRGKEFLKHKNYWTDILTNGEYKTSMEALDSFFAAKEIEKKESENETNNLTNKSIQFEKDNEEWCAQMRNTAKNKGWDSVKQSLRSQVMDAYDHDEKHGEKISAAIIWAKEMAGQNKILNF